MTPKPKFSFVIPVYNPPENLFRRCLESCLDQEGVAFEIVVVNDGSTNNVGEILDEYASRHPGIFKIVTQENKGNGPAKKAGLENASGEFLWVIDNDDRVRPNCIKRLVDALEQYGADQILFKAVRVEIADLDRPFPPCDDPVLKLVSKEYVFASGIRAFWKRVVRKTLVDKCHVDIPRSFHDDWPTTMRWTLEAEKTIEMDCVNYFWIQNSSSITHTKYSRPELLKSSLKTLELFQKWSEDFPQFKRWMVLEIFRSARANLNRVRQSKKMPEAKTIAVQNLFKELETEYNTWLGKYSDEDKILVIAYDEATASLRKSVKDLTCKVRALSEGRCIDVLSRESGLGGRLKKFISYCKKKLLCFSVKH